MQKIAACIVKPVNQPRRKLSGVSSIVARLYNARALRVAQGLRYSTLVTLGEGMKFLRLSMMALALLGADHATAASDRLAKNFETLIDKYLAEFHGTGTGPSIANDGSATYFGNRLQIARSLLAELEAIDRQPLTFQQDIDYRYLRGILRAKILEGERVMYWQKDPTLYLRIEPIVSARGGLLYLEDKPVAERAASVLAVMKKIPARLQNAQENLRVYIPLWLEPAKGLLDGAIETFEADVLRFADRVPDQRADLLAENEKVLAALREFGNFLNTEWPTRPKGQWRVGKDVFDTQLRDLYHIQDHDAESLYAWGRAQYTEQLRVLDRAAAQVDDGRSWREIEADLQADHPTEETMLNDFQVQVRRARPWLIENDLMTVPWDQVNAAAAIYTPAYYNKLTFTGFGGAPVGRGSTFPGAVMLVPMDPRWSTEEKDRFLRSHNYAFITALMPHEVYPGHGLIALYNNHNPRKLRTYESAYSNQAWCYYVEWVLTPDFGFYPPEKQAEYRLEMERLKLWRYARVIYDTGMHLGHVTVDEAVDLMTSDVMFAEPYSFLQVQGSTHGYVRTGIPTWGYHEFLALRDEYFSRMYLMGRTGTLKDFHDRVLKIGTLPFTLLREELFHDIAEGGP